MHITRNFAVQGRTNAAGAGMHWSDRDYVNASITFDGLAKATRLPTKSLQRMLGPRGNPMAESLFAIFKVLHDYMDARGRATPEAVAEKSERIRLAVTHKGAVV